MISNESLKQGQAAGPSSGHGTWDLYRNLLDNLHDGVYFADRNRVIRYWNKAAERITGYQAGEVIGSRCEDDILSHVDAGGCSLCTADCPLSAAIAEIAPKERDVFLHHKEGHRVPVWIRTSPVLDAEGQVIGAVELMSDNSAKLNALQRVEELQELAYIDPVTITGNRRYAEVTLQNRIDELQRYGWSFGVLFVDLDNFKDINDRYGHQTGDDVLLFVAKTLSSNLRTSDFVARWGGDEFIVIVTNVSGRVLASMTDKLRLLISQSFLHSEKGKIRVTVSIGGGMARADDTPQSLLSRADKLLYASKSNGKNRVRLEQ